VLGRHVGIRRELLDRPGDLLLTSMLLEPCLRDGTVLDAPRRLIAACGSPAPPKAERYCAAPRFW